MKKILLFSIMTCLGIGLMAQSLKYSKPVNVPRQAVPAAITDNPLLPQQVANSFVQSKAALEDVIGETRYDAQTNSAIPNRLIVWPDGSMSSAWTKAQLDGSWTDRGTGYNYYDGSAWGTPPTQRIESVKTGWPTMDKWNGTGEIVIAHQSGTTPLVMNTRPVKGTGTWTQSLINPPTGASGLLWPRMITSGPTNNYVHMIVLSSPTGNGGVTYQGLDGALLYYRSTNGGETWDKNGIILPGLESANYDGFSGDEYAWGSPHGDTLYFAVACAWTDSFIMESVDNGENWTKIPVLSNANKKLPSGTTEVQPFYAADGAVALEMDKAGVIHMAFGKGGGYMSAGTKYIYVNVNGLIYWNSTMPMIQDSLVLDSLEAHGNLLGYVSDGPNPGDTIIAAPSYRVGLSSHPQISIDPYNNIYCLYSAVTPGNPSPDPYNYRHMWARAKFHDKATWTDMLDLNTGVLYMYTEFAFANMAKTILNDNLNVIYQSSSQPGSAIQVTTITVHDNNIEHRSIPGSTFWPEGIANPVAKANTVSQNCPNPVNGVTRFDVTLTKAANVVVEVSNIMGQKVMSFDKGLVNSGLSTYTIDGSQLTSGIYFYTVKINGESYTHKMIVE
ncbi:MAG: T9SS type A sorting domain-containing protein [Bacteroidales bacterium]|nr:T9SS type A sorting domain-containing protein [Bacteroidales bacterium]